MINHAKFKIKYMRSKLNEQPQLQICEDLCRPEGNGDNRRKVYGRLGILINFLTGFMILTFLISSCVFAELPNTLIPVGKTVGITVLSDGINVVNTTEFTTTDGDRVSPAAEAGIRAGDRITEIDGKKTNSAAELEKICERKGETEIEVTYVRDDEEDRVCITPKTDSSDNKVRLGIWVKDSSSGIGTITYINPETGGFGALGHGICDSGGDLSAICGGKILEAEISSIQRGEKGVPGELVGIFTENADVLGTVEKNTENGIFGKVQEEKKNKLGIVYDEGIPVGKRSEVKEGAVEILSNPEGGEAIKYSAEIIKINDDEEASKGMIIKITDPVLTEKTGGIVQGMSGSPIICDGKLIGAVTHVCVNL